MSITFFIWTVQSYDFNLAYSNTFFFWVNPGLEDQASSRYFYLAANQSSSTTSTATSKTSASTTQPAITLYSSSASSGLSSSVKVGIGVGVGIGTPVLITLLVTLIVLLRWQKSLSRRNIQEQPALQGAEYPNAKKNTLPHIFEVSGGSNVAELPIADC